MPKRKKSNPSKPSTSQSLRIAVKISSKFSRVTKDVLGRTLAARLGARSPFTILPLIESLDEKRLAELVSRARQAEPEAEISDFTEWFQLVVPEGESPEELEKALRKIEMVEIAYVMRPGPPPLVNPANDPRSTNQGYLDAAPNGIDARYAWGFAGGDGAGVGFVDMEQGWNLNHEDLTAAGITLMSGVSQFFFEHGTSVLGEVRMSDNALGGVGIAPSASGRVISQWRTAASYNTADAIVSAAAGMTFGDILLLEAQEYDPVGGAYFWPVEIADANYAAIRLATALGIVVVEAGCNGGYDLNPYVNLSGKHIFDRTSPDFRDSGAIMVGAGSSAAPHTRLGFSNHGNRIDCYAWGENIDTTTTNSTGTDNAAYTTGFGGTSGASPIVVGAGLIVQGIAQSALGYRFSPRALRRILTINGTPSANPGVDEIGVMPDLRAIITGSEINLAPDLFVRDNVSDVGNPTSGVVSQSPDIIVVTPAVVDPQGAFGEGSGTENNASLSTDVDAANGDHTVYVRLRNRGGSAALAVTVDVYWSPPSTLVTPNLWTAIGTTAPVDVPTGNVLTVTPGLNWPAASLPAPGHYCFVAIAGNTADPKVGLATMTNFTQYLTLIQNNNNVAWRNFDVVPIPPSAPPPPQAMPFFIAGAFDTSRVFALETVGRLPEGSRVVLEVPGWLADSLKPHPQQFEKIPKSDRWRITLNPAGVQRLGELTLHAKSLAKCLLRVKLPKIRERDGFEFQIRQLYRQAEVGSITWRFVGRGKK
jgi:hypothetical protein